MSDRQVRLPLGRYLPPAGSEFVSVEAGGGVVLLAATVAALVWANVSEASYDDLWHRTLTIGAGSFSTTLDLRHWVNEGLMAVFFFVVGMEIKRELVGGELRDRRRATLPIAAAVGGMAVPAALYAVLNTGGEGGEGWAIPMATDIAFAVAVLALLGERAPRNLRLFLLSLAIVDDLGAVLVIAAFYAEQIRPEWGLGAVAVAVAVIAMARLGLSHPGWFVAPALALWVCVHESGVHATIAGVVLGFVTPISDSEGEDVLGPLEHRLHPLSSFLVIPIFALANAGVTVDAGTLRDAATGAVGLGIALGLVIGKPVGIVAATALTVRLGLSRLPDGVGIRHIAGAGALAGIGFTVSLFVAGLAFEGSALVEAKAAILAASLLSATIGASLLARDGQRERGISRRPSSPER